ncbi:PTS sugar transporter subunit IIA [Mycoplasma sp. 'Moose RK']|uniref:PTS sugar transporter subunit IIA n=1 Tax=Mycoplasma sp. 'Moose RK' TaxID=2780095 RepID=UPI0018C2A2D9|nr:PTS sugar transporter subunit IIA [Mycoplasma sp. 'Moose RK']MBG0731080.1 PTS sugar transporter subunit IIA [Mycoplasma sp. 'Moose RK']
MSVNLLKNLIENDSILVNQQANTWKEAVEISCKPLLDKNLISQKYVDGIIDSTIENGPYYIIAPFLAMPHAAAGHGVFEDCFSLVTFKKPFYFDGDSRPIQILITLGATSSDIHTSVALPQIVAVFENSENVEAIVNAKNKDEIISLIQQVDFTKYLEK